MNYVISGVQFDEDGGITIQWADADEVDDEGGTYHNTHISPFGQERDARVGYYSAELRQDVEELLHAWLKYRRGETR